MANSPKPGVLQEHFDLERIRRNWQRTDAARVVEPPERLGHVAPPLDVYLEGELLLQRLRRQIADEFPSQREMLALFVARIEASFARLRDEQSRELREEFMTTLHELEDLCEALLVGGRR